MTERPMGLRRGVDSELRHRLVYLSCRLADTPGQREGYSYHMALATTLFRPLPTLRMPNVKVKVILVQKPLPRDTNKHRTDWST